MSAPQFHPLTVSDIRPEAEDACVISFDVPARLAAAFAFTPGQHLTLRQGELRRSYSVCAAPGEGLRVGVRKVPGGVFSTWLHAHVRPGSVLDVMEPQGQFGRSLVQRPQHVLAVAGGSGITPILSILKTVLRDDARARCTLLYANRTAASAMFKAELADLKDRHLTRLALHPVFSREAVDSPLHSGRLDAERIHTLLRLAGPVDQAFVCGPHAMNDDAETALHAAGLRADQVHVERFGIPPEQAAAAAPPTQAPGDAATARVRIVRDGLARECSFQPGDASILAAAVRAGLDLPFSCRSGVCATCRARVLEGRVRMDRNFALEPADLAAGFVLACQAHPLTERVSLSFDER